MDCLDIQTIHYLAARSLSHIRIKLGGFPCRYSVLLRRGVRSTDECNANIGAVMEGASIRGSE